jgi:hypothetical protein
VNVVLVDVGMMALLGGKKFGSKTPARIDMKYIVVVAVVVVDDYQS